MSAPRDWGPASDRARPRRPRASFLTHSTRNAHPARNDLHKMIQNCTPRAAANLWIRH